MRKLYEHISDVDSNCFLGPYRSNEVDRIDVFLNSINPSRDKTILITRDPVDCISSWFFAAKLHNRPEDWDGSNFNDPNLFAAQRASKYYESCEGLEKLAATNLPLVLTYEEIVMSPMNYIGRVLEYLDADVSQSNINTAANLMSFISPYENTRSHRRNGIPGQGRKILESSVVNEVDSVFKSFNDIFCYPCQEPSEHEIKYLREISSIRNSLEELMEKFAEIDKKLKK